jgi:hypothetical protein
MRDIKQSIADVNDTSAIEHLSKEIYQKPKTSVFLETAKAIESGATTMLESQSGTGYLIS